MSYYTWTPSSGAAPELVREFCPNGSSTPASHEILSDNLSSTNLPAPTVSCISPTPTSIPTGVSCPATGSNWTPTYMVSNVTLNVTQGCSGVGSRPAPPTSSRSQATRSRESPSRPSTSPAAWSRSSVLKTTSTWVATLIASEQLNAQGPIVLNSGYNTGGGNNAAISSSFSLFSSVSVDATASSTCHKRPLPRRHRCLQLQQHQLERGEHELHGLSHERAAHHRERHHREPQSACADQHGGHSDRHHRSPAHVGESATGDQHHHTLSDVPTQANMNCPPGLYTSGLTIPNNATVTFQAGNPYEFAGSVNCSGTQTSLCIQSNDTVNFGSGRLHVRERYRRVRSGPRVRGHGHQRLPSPAGGAACSSMSRAVRPTSETISRRRACRLSATHEQPRPAVAGRR